MRRLRTPSTHSTFWLLPVLVETAARWLTRAVGLALWAYHVGVSPLIAPCCRFAPSCSVYAAEAIRRYGIRRGGWMSLKRVLRCHPYHPGGWDPVV